MDKILKAADDIAAVFNITQEWLEPGRSAVVKILKQLMEDEKFTSTNSAMDAIAKLVEMRDEMCKRSDVNDAVYKWLEVTKDVISILSSQRHQ